MYMLFSMIVFFCTHTISYAMDFTHNIIDLKHNLISRAEFIKRYGATADHVLHNASYENGMHDVSSCIDDVPSCPKDVQLLIKDYIGSDTIMPLYRSSATPFTTKTPFYKDTVLVFSDDGEHAFVRTLAKTLWKCNIESGNSERYKPFAKKYVFTCAVHKEEFFYVASNENRNKHARYIYYTDGNDDDDIAVFIGTSPYPITTFAFNDSVFVYGTQNGIMQLYDKNSLTLLHTEYDYGAPKTCLYFYNQSIVASASNKTTYMYDRRSHDEIPIRRMQGLLVQCMKGTEPYIFFGTKEGEIYLIDMRKTDDMVCIVPTLYKSPVTALGMCKDDSLRVANEGVITTWKPAFDKNKEWEHISLEELCLVTRL